jgi:uncharacterized protein YunC (DUF1805 family)
MKIPQFHINGRDVQGLEIALPGGNTLVVAVADKGYVMCGYLNLQAAQKFNDAAAIVRGVKTVEDLLAAPIAEVTPAAAALGVSPGMTGREALAKLTLLKTP